jgi:hypothetical protein
MRYILNVGLLEPGDIILVGYNDKNSREIQQKTNSKYSHAMLYWNSSILHASSIVITANPSRFLFDEDENVCILRLKDEYRKPNRIKCITDYARNLVGTYYDFGALFAMRRGEEVTPNKNRQMCSKFVAQCYNHAGLDLVDNYEICTPEDIHNSNLLLPLSEPLLEATQEDIDFYESYDVTKVQYKAIKDFLDALNKEFPEKDIVSLKQLELFIEKEPSNGDKVLDLLKATDYFNLWKLEKENNQYLYNTEEFKKRWKDEGKTIDQAFAVINESKIIIQEKESDIYAYEMKIGKIGELEYYKQMIKLREKIIETAKERIKVAEQVLADYQIVKIKYPWLL